MNLRTLTKVALLRAGSRSSEKTIHYLNALFDYAELGWWLRSHEFSGGFRLSSCLDMPGVIAADVGVRPVLYIQFGAEDEDMAPRWAHALRHPETRLHVFDAAEDRQGQWLPARGRGHWWESQRSTRSAPADEKARLEALDPRGEYFSGALPDLFAGYEWPEAEIVVAVFDTDHYGTTKAALDFIGPRLPTQAYLFFDQLNHRADELRAFHEFLEESGRSFDLFAGNRELSCIAFRARQV